jgi:putative hydrolase of HD superfamily
MGVRRRTGGGIDGKREPHRSMTSEAMQETDRAQRLQRQLEFIVEIDRLKTVLRQTSIGDASRRENSAEHSWHLAVMAVLLSEYAPPGTEVIRSVKMALIHDIVEIDAGDAFCYDPAATAGKEDRERLAAERLFHLLPEDQAAELHELWREYEEMTSPDARFANALDRLQPLLQNLENEGGTWRLHGVSRERVLERMRPILDGMSGLWPFVEQQLDRAAAAGWVR